MASTQVIASSTMRFSAYDTSNAGGEKQGILGKYISPTYQRGQVMGQVSHGKEVCTGWYGWVDVKIKPKMCMWAGRTAAAAAVELRSLTTTTHRSTCMVPKSIQNV